MIVGFLAGQSCHGDGELVGVPGNVHLLCFEELLT